MNHKKEFVMAFSFCRYIFPMLFVLAEAAIIFFCGNHDLQARWFGFLVGISTGFVFLPAGTIHQKYFLPPQNASKKRFFTVAVTAGYLSGLILDTLYFAFYAEFINQLFLILFAVELILVFWFFQSRFSPRNFTSMVIETSPTHESKAVSETGENIESEQAAEPIQTPESPCSDSSRSEIRIFNIGQWVKCDILLLLSSLLPAVLVFSMATPCFILQKREPQEGIYIYANDVACTIPGANIISVRLRFLTHTGLCLITKTPDRINQIRLAAGKNKLNFTKLNDEYWIRDLNLDIQNYDGFTNYGSSTSLDDRSFPFDIDNWKHYLEGRSMNDRLHPAIQVLKLPVENVLEAWERVETFKNEINTKYPEGFIYSPVPYQGNYVRFFNCNSLTVGIADGILDCGKEAEKMTNRTIQIGGQGREDGRKLLADYQSPEFAENIKKERDFMKKQPYEKQKWIHRILNRQN